MAGVTKEQLKKEIAEILKDADLTVLSAKKVRQQLEKKLGCDLTPRKKEVDSLVMDYVNRKEKNNKSASEDDESDEEEESEEESEESEEDTSSKNKRAAPARKPPAKKPSKKNSSTEDEGSESEENASDDEYSPSKTASNSKKGGGAKKRKGSDSDSDEDWKKPVTKRSKKAPGAGGKGKGTGFTRALQLSPELAALMGAESLPRHEVVKKMWAMIKERNLYDPKNKQYAICDGELIKVFGVKRFRTFGMLKYLRPHFID